MTRIPAILVPSSCHRPLPGQGVARRHLRRRRRAHPGTAAPPYFQQYSGAPGDKQRRQKASYYGMIELIDEQVGRMLEALSRTGQRDNTVVIFMSDDGEMLGDHGLTTKGCRFYEGAVRVPLIV